MLFRNVTIELTATYYAPNHVEQQGIPSSDRSNNVVTRTTQTPLTLIAATKKNT